MELFQCNSSILNSLGLTYKALMPFMKTCYFFVQGKLIRKILFSYFHFSCRSIFLPISNHKLLTLQNTNPCISLTEHCSLHIRLCSTLFLPSM